MEDNKIKIWDEIKEDCKQLNPIYIDTDCIKVSADNFEKIERQMIRFKKLQLMSTYGICLTTQPIIKGIYPNEEKKLVVVRWYDDTITKVTCGKDDVFDIYIGVALAVCKRFFGSNSRFRKTVDNLTKGDKK